MPTASFGAQAKEFFPSMKALGVVLMLLLNMPNYAEDAPSPFSSKATSSETRCRRCSQRAECLTAEFVSSRRFGMVPADKRQTDIKTKHNHRRKAFANSGLLSIFAI